MTDPQITIAVITYLILSGIITLIWVTIPMYINVARDRYSLPPKMVIWPIYPEFFNGMDSYGATTALLIVGIFITIPVGILWITFLGLRKICKRAIYQVAFTRKDKAQIAVGTITPQKPDSPRFPGM